MKRQTDICFAELADEPRRNVPSEKYSIKTDTGSITQTTHIWRRTDGRCTERVHGCDSAHAPSVLVSDDGLVHRLLQPPMQGKGVGPKNHIHASPRGSLRVVPRVKGSQDHSAHQERFIAAVQLVDGVLLRLDSIGKAASLPLRCTRRARDIHQRQAR